MADVEERFAVYVRDRGEHHLRAAALLTGDWHAAEDLMQASLVKLHRAWPKLRMDSDPDAYLRRMGLLTQRPSCPGDLRGQKCRAHSQSEDQQSGDDGMNPPIAARPEPRDRKQDRGGRRDEHCPPSVEIEREP